MTKDKRANAGDGPAGPFEIRLSRPAAKALAKLDSDTKTRIVGTLNSLAQGPRTVSGVVALSGRDAFRIRVGSYRVIYELDDDVLVVLVLRIAHRREAYR